MHLKTLYRTLLENVLLGQSPLPGVIICKPSHILGFKLKSRKHILLETYFCLFVCFGGVEEGGKGGGGRKVGKV